ncbi:MAG: ABC transporter permease subunit, partial [Actinomycetes bacterium]
MFLSVLGSFFASMTNTAHAADYALRIQVKEQSRDASGKTDNQPVAGVSISVTDANGVEVGAGETDESGVVVIPVPDKADYTITLDESTLPDGQSLDAKSSPVQTVSKDSFVTTTKIINFFTGESQSESQTFVERLSQRILDGIRLGLVLAMCAVGLSLIFGTTGLTNFAHGEIVTFGGLATFVFNITGLSFLGFLAFLPG